MIHRLRRALAEGAFFGLISAGLLGLAMAAVSWAQGQALVHPFRGFERLLGFDGMSPTLTLVAGGIVLVALGGIVGAVYGFLDAQLTESAQTNWVWQLFLGLCAGAGLYSLSQQLLGRPWGVVDFIYGAPPLSLGLHMLFFGLPLAVLYRSRALWARQGQTQVPAS